MARMCSMECEEISNTCKYSREYQLRKYTDIKVMKSCLMKFKVKWVEGTYK